MSRRGRRKLLGLSPAQDDDDILPPIPSPQRRGVQRDSNPRRRQKIPPASRRRTPHAPSNPSSSPSSDSPWSLPNPSLLTDFRHSSSHSLAICVSGRLPFLPFLDTNLFEQSRLSLRSPHPLNSSKGEKWKFDRVISIPDANGNSEFVALSYRLFVMKYAGLHSMPWHSLASVRFLRIPWEGVTDVSAPDSEARSGGSPKAMVLPQSGYGKSRVEVMGLASLTRSGQNPLVLAATELDFYVLDPFNEDETVKQEVESRGGIMGDVRRILSLGQHSSWNEGVIAFGIGDRHQGGRLEIIDLKTESPFAFRQILLRRDEEGGVNALASSPNFLISGGGGGGVKIWSKSAIDANSDADAHVVFPSECGAVMSLEFANNLIVAGMQTGVVQVRDFRRLDEILFEINAHEPPPPPPPPSPPPQLQDGDISLGMGEMFSPMGRVGFESDIDFGIRIGYSNYERVQANRMNCVTKPGGGGQVLDLVAEGSSSTMVSVSSNWTMCRFDAQSGKVLRRKEMCGGLSGIAWIGRSDVEESLGELDEETFQFLVERIRSGLIRACRVSVNSCVIMVSLGLLFALV